MKNDTGGPAYPNFSYEEDDRGKYHPGMTLLDYFAGLAMQKLLREKLRHIWSFKYDSVAKNAYNQAEAMIEEKRKRENG